MNKGLVDKLVESTRDWIDYADVSGYNDVSDDDIMFGADTETREILLDLKHYEYIGIIEDVHNRLSNDWEDEF